MKLNTYLHFKDNAEEALNFYAKALGGKVAMMLRFNESPAAGECGKDMGPKIMHGRIVIGDNVIMASDCPPEHYKPQAGFSVNIGVDSAKEAETIFAALSEKAQAIIMPLAETFWGRALRYVRRPVRHSLDGELARRSSNCVRTEGDGITE